MIVWTDYQTRGFMLDLIGRRFCPVTSDTSTPPRKNVAVGKHDRLLVLIPYERMGDSITPVTIRNDEATD